MLALVVAADGAGVAAFALRLSPAGLGRGKTVPLTRVTADVTALVLENDVWISVVPEEADRVALWQAPAWE